MRERRAKFPIPIKTPSERIIARDVLAAAFNAERMIREGKFIVDLECGHKAYTRALNRAVCPRCTEMLRRSIEDGREDWDGFRHHGKLDHMEWPADPCRQFNERTNLAGEFD
jgi:hypothetical protein